MSSFLARQLCTLLGFSATVEENTGYFDVLLLFLSLKQGADIMPFPVCYQVILVSHDTSGKHVRYFFHINCVTVPVFVSVQDPGSQFLTVNS